MAISEQTRQRAEEIVARYPQPRSALLPMLHLVQSEEGWVSPEGVALCADVLDLTKAEVGAVSRDACQLQGVWVHPKLRGRGLSVPAMAAVVRHCLRDHADVVSLYVNDYNTRARATYASVGFSEVGTFATVLF